MDYSVPVPTNYREIEDNFTSLIMGAPHFEILQRAVTYTLTLDMIVRSLLSGIEQLERRSKSESAKNSYSQSIEAVRAGLQEYANGRELQGNAQFMQAHNIFRSATNKGPKWKL